MKKNSFPRTWSSTLDIVLEVVVDEDVLWMELRTLRSLDDEVSGARSPLKKVYALSRDTCIAADPLSGKKRIQDFAKCGPPPLDIITFKVVLAGLY